MTALCGGWRLELIAPLPDRDRVPPHCSTPSVPLAVSPFADQLCISPFLDGVATDRRGRAHLAPSFDAVFAVSGRPTSSTPRPLPIVAAAIIFSGPLVLVPDYTVAAVRRCAPRVDPHRSARLVGIRPVRTTGTIAHPGVTLAGISGVLIAPVTTIFYDDWLLTGPEGLVGAIIGAMASYPATAVGAVMVGLPRAATPVLSSRLRSRGVWHPDPGACCGAPAWPAPTTREVEE